VLRAGGLADHAFGRVTAQTLAAANAVIALGRDMRDRILARYGRYVRSDHIHVVTPWADGRELYPIEKHENPLAAELGAIDTFNIVYSGNLGVAHDVQTIVGAIERTLCHTNLRWLFIGGGKGLDQLRAQAARANWSHVRILPYQPRERLNQSLNLADVHLVSQLPPFVGLVVPSKLFGIMAVGKPTIMVGPREAECSRILVKHDAGAVTPNGDALQLTQTIERFAAEPESSLAMGRRARDAFDRHYERHLACDRIMAILERGGNKDRSSDRPVGRT
jgi:colanic acid biosynthesis glycosyl transferase WcaI